MTMRPWTVRTPVRRAPALAAPRSPRCSPAAASAPPRCRPTSARRPPGCRCSLTEPDVTDAGRRAGVPVQVFLLCALAAGGRGPVGAGTGRRGGGRSGGCWSRRGCWTSWPRRRRRPRAEAGYTTDVRGGMTVSGPGPQGPRRRAAAEHPARRPHVRTPSPRSSARSPTRRPPRGDGTVVLGGPDASPLRRYACTDRGPLPPGEPGTPIAEGGRDEPRRAGARAARQAGPCPTPPRACRTPVAAHGLERGGSGSGNPEPIVPTAASWGACSVKARAAAAPRIRIRAAGGRPPRRPPRARRLAHAAPAGRPLGDARQPAPLRRHPGRPAPWARPEAARRIGAGLALLAPLGVLLPMAARPARTSRRSPPWSVRSPRAP